MKITKIEVFPVALPFEAPIFSAYGVSYPARLRAYVRLTTDTGLTGLGETGPSPAHKTSAEQVGAAVRAKLEPAILGESPYDYLHILKKLRYAPEGIAVEVACWDLMAKAAGVPLYRFLGGQGEGGDVPTAAYFFFRGKAQDGHGEVTLDSAPDHAKELLARYGFDTLKMKLGVYAPEDEVECVQRVRKAIGPRIKLRVDPNGCWSLPTVKRMLKKLEDCDLQFLEEPLKYAPARRMNSTNEGVPGVDTDGLRALRQSTLTPICADGCYRIDLLVQIAKANCADVVLGDIQGSGGIRGLHEYFSTAHLFNLGSALHSGSETGILQAAKVHVAAAHPEIRIAGDAIYHQYTDDCLRGEAVDANGMLAYKDGCMRLPQAPGLGVELDEERAHKLALDESKLAGHDAFWQEVKESYAIPPAGPDLLVRRF